MFFPCFPKEFTPMQTYITRERFANGVCLLVKKIVYSEQIIEKKLVFCSGIYYF